MCSSSKMFGHKLFDCRVGTLRTWVAKENPIHTPVQPEKENKQCTSVFVETIIMLPQAGGLDSVSPMEEPSGGHVIMCLIVNKGESSEDEVIVMMQESEFSSSLEMVLYEGEKYIRKEGLGALHQRNCI